MEKNRQIQSAGDNSTQTQNIIINQGMSVSQAREILEEGVGIVLKEFTKIAQDMASKHVNSFGDVLLPKLVAYDPCLKFFVDPAFHHTLGKAQLSAALSDQKSKYELLSELLLHRVKHGNDLMIISAVNRAIEIAWEVTDDALVGLSVMYATTKLSPNSNNLHQGLSLMNEIYGKIMNKHQLPIGRNWIEHLSMLGAIRLSEAKLVSFTKFKDYISNNLSKYLVSGIEMGSEDLGKIEEEFKSCGIPLNCIITHPLKPNYVILNTCLDVDKIRLNFTFDGITLTQELNHKQKEIINKVTPLFRKDESKDPAMRDAFFMKWNEYPNLKIVGEWWDSLPIHFTLTPVGVALSNAYSHGQDPQIPSLY